jgi:hypothetical protein
MAESPKKGGGIKIILGAILALVFGAVGYFVYDKYLKGKLNIGGNTNTGNNTDTGTGGDTTTPPPTQQENGTITIQAVNNSDPYLRDWDIFTRDPTGTYQGGGVWSIGNPLKTTDKMSGGTWEVTLPKGTYYLLIGQSGGSGYGTYSGTITINGASIPFAGVDVNHAAQFTIA